MEAKISKKTLNSDLETSSQEIPSSKMSQFLEKLKEMPDPRQEQSDSKLTKKEKFLQKILEEIGPHGKL